MKNWKKLKIKNFIFSIVCCISIVIFINNISQAEIVETEDVNNELNEMELSNNYLNAINLSNDVAKQSIDNPYEDKPYSDEYIKWLNLSDEEKEKYGNTIPPKEFIAIHKNITKENDELNLDEKSIEATANNLPSYYKMSDLTVENQSKSGWCWAYSSLKCLQTYFQRIKNIKYNFAEYHLAYMRYTQYGRLEQHI